MEYQTTIGVAVITYNGLKYLPEQLASILGQSRPVDHIVISDDRSTDGTWEFLEEWAQSAPMRVTLLRNERQLGLSGNFEQAINAVEADLILTSDQDDVWLPHKVSLLATVFEKDPEVLLVHTDASLIDAKGQDMGTTLLGELMLSDSERAAIQANDAFTVYCRRNLATGATVGIRRTLLKLALPLSDSHYHDAWLALIASAAGKVRLLDVPTIAYRQHGGNLVGVKKLSFLMKCRQLSWKIRGPHPVSQSINGDLKWRSALYERLLSTPSVPHSVLACASAALSLYQRRAALPRQAARRLAAVLGIAVAGDYHRYSYTPWSDALRDVLNK